VSTSGGVGREGGVVLPQFTLPCIRALSLGSAFSIFLRFLSNLLPVFGVPLFGVPLFGVPLFGVPLFGVPLLEPTLLGIAVLGIELFKEFLRFSVRFFLFSEANWFEGKYGVFIERPKFIEFRLFFVVFKVLDIYSKLD
jgi:hypothetical protein